MEVWALFASSLLKWSEHRFVVVVGAGQCCPDRHPGSPCGKELLDVVAWLADLFRKAPEWEPSPVL